MLEEKPGAALRTETREKSFVTPTETARVQSYLRQKFDNNRIALRKRPQDTDSLEVLLGDEFIGTIYRDDEEGEVSYDFNMAILAIDLPELD